MKITYAVPPTRKWIIKKEYNTCYLCDDIADTHIIVDETKKLILVNCQDCGYKTTYPLCEFRESRPCMTCNFERVVKVKISEPEELWEENCEICQLIAAATNHENQARAIREKARQMLAARQQKHPY